MPESQKIGISSSNNGYSKTPNNEPCSSASLLAEDEKLLSGFQGLDNILRQLPNSLSLEDRGSKSRENRHEFWIRDINNDDQVFKGAVLETPGLHVKFQDDDGHPFLEIVSEPNSGRYGVRHGKIELGYLGMELDNPSSLKIYRNYENRNFTVNFKTRTDISIALTSRLNNPICKIHVPMPPIPRQPFTGSRLSFLEPPKHITIIQKCLSFALAVVYILSRGDEKVAKKKQKKAAKASRTISESPDEEEVVNFGPKESCSNATWFGLCIALVLAIVVSILILYFTLR